MNFKWNEAVELLTEKLSLWWEQGVKIIPNFIVALVVLLFFVFLAKFVRKTFPKIFRRLNTNATLSSLFSAIAYIFILLIGLFISLEILNLEKTVTSLLAGAGVIGIALGFAFQEIASNFVSGILIAFREPFKIDDIVEVKDYMGTIKEINLRTTHIMTFDGLEVIIPNKYMFTEPIVNYTTTPKRRLDLAVGVSYDSDLEKVEQICLAILNNLEDRIKGIEPEFYYTEFADSSINFVARVWIKYPENKAFLKRKHDLIKRIKRRFDAEDINIPFPIRTLDVPDAAWNKVQNLTLTKKD